MRLVVMLLSLLLAPQVWAVKVSLSAPQEVVIYPHFGAPASVLSLKHTEVGSEVAGVAAQIDVKVGDELAQGEVIARIDPFLYQQAVTQAEAALLATGARIELAEYQLKQAKRLSQQQNVSDELLVTRKAELASLKAEQQAQQAALAIAQRNLDKSLIKAPFSGVVSQRFAHQGQYLAPGAPVITLVSQSVLEVSAQLQAADAPSLQAAQQLVYRWQNQVFPVQLRTVAPVMDVAQRTREARLVFSEAKALVGSSGRLQWQSSQAYLPAELLVRRGDDLGVFIYDNGVARFIVLPDAQEGRSVLASRLPENAQLIIQGRYSLQDGDAVELP